MAFYDDDTQTYRTGGITFTGQSLGTILTESEYTQVHFVIDKSSSVADFSDKIEALLRRCVKVLKKHPNANNMILRVTLFSDAVEEMHGWRLMTAIDEKDYAGAVRCGGWTALNAATHEGVTAVIEHGKMLVGSNVNTNALLIVFSDGANNRPGVTTTQIREKLARVKKNEAYSSFVTILVGINVDGDDYDGSPLRPKLEKFREDAGLTHFLDGGTASDENIAKLCGFVIQSVSSTSQALATGGPSQMIAPGANVGQSLNAQPTSLQSLTI
jgi:hypothetical protein